MEEINKLINNLLNKEIKIQDYEINKLIKNNNITLSNSAILKKFYNERNIVVSSSRIETYNEKEKYNKKISTPPDKNYSEIIYERDLDEDVDSYLKENKLESSEKGKRYLGLLIKLLYHERELFDKIDRELFDKIDNDEFNYFNLNDYSNIHYKYIDDKAPETVISEIIETIVNSSEEQIEISVNDIVYNAVDKICSYRHKNNPLKNQRKKI